MSEKKGEPLFKKQNYILLILGICFIIFGFILMTGGESPNPNVFNEEVFSFRRIRLAPMFVLTGFILEIYAIFYCKK